MIDRPVRHNPTNNPQFKYIIIGSISFIVILACMFIMLSRKVEQ